MLVGVLLPNATKFYYVNCPGSNQPFWIYQELVAWPWCNLASSQRRPYCASVNSHSPVGLVSWQWDAVDWACVLCDVGIHNDPSEQTSESASMRLPILQLTCRLFLANHHITQVCQHPYSTNLAPWNFWFFSKLKSPLKVRRFVNATVTQYTSSVNGVLQPTD